MRNNIIHRDLKPGNILIHNGKYKIGDFGHSKICFNTYRKEQCGTLYYLAPEYYMNKNQMITNIVDMYSLGVIVYKLMYTNLRHPYLYMGSEYITDEKLFREKVKVNSIYFPPKPERSSELKDLVK